MYGSILALHAIGFFIFDRFVVPAHYKGLGIGVSVLAYTLGLSARLRRRPHLGHRQHDPQGHERAPGHRPASPRWPTDTSSRWAIPPSSSPSEVGIIIAEKTVFAAVSNNNSSLELFGGLFGTIVSAPSSSSSALLNLVVLAGIVKVFRSMRQGHYDEAELERQLDKRGLFYRSWVDG